MKVFIENEAGKAIKNIHNEKTLEFKKSYELKLAYPYPYGFILNTTSGDGDNLDCFVLTNQKLKTGQTVDCEPIALMKQVENGNEDYNVIAVLKGESTELTPGIKEKLTQFTLHVFDHWEWIKDMRVEGFDSKEAALKYIESCKD